MKKTKLLLLGALAVIAVAVAAVCFFGNFSGQPGDVAPSIPSVPTDPIHSSDESRTIPVISLDGNCLEDYTNWNDKSTYYSATFAYSHGDSSFTTEIELKPQGTTSLYAPKKNFTLKFAEDVTFVDQWGAHKKYVLKADYIDPTCSGNVVSAKLAAEMNEKYGLFADTPNHGVIDGFPVQVMINGKDAGIFNLTIPKDAWLFNMDSSNPNHLVLACEGWSEASRMQTAQIDYEKDWSFEVGEPTDENKAAFERMVSFVCTADDDTFVEQFDQYFDLDACLNYICFINAAYAKDNVAKNMLMVTYDGKIWYPALYDLDSLWGVDALGTGLMEPTGVWPSEPLANGNCLLYRVNYFFGDQVRERYQELREGILSKEHIMESFEAYTAQIPQECYDINNSLWYTDGSRIRTLELMSQLMDEYLPIVDQALLNPSPVPPADLTPSEGQSVELKKPTVHYVWETDGSAQSLDQLQSLPVSMTFTYKLDGSPISVQDLPGKSGQLEITMRVERRVDSPAMLGVAAVMQVAEAQCRDITTTGGVLSKSAEKNTALCTGSAWLGNPDNAYEMKMRMQVTDFEPARYAVVIIPAHVEEVSMNSSMQMLLTTASELTTVINDGLNLHAALVEWHTYLTTVQSVLGEAETVTQSLIPAQGEAENADSVMQNLLAKAEAEASALLTSWGYQSAATTADRVKLLSQAAASPNLTAEEKARAAGLKEQLEGYLVVFNHLQTSRQSAENVVLALQNISGMMPDLVGAYSFANDSLYANMHKISTLYQTIATYYDTVRGSALAGSADQNTVIIFTNHDSVLP